MKTKTNYFGKISALVAAIIFMLAFENAKAQTLSFTMSADTAYIGNVVSFTNTSVGFGSTHQFIWNFGDHCSIIDSICTDLSLCNDTTVGASVVQNHIYYETGSFTVWLYANNNGVLDSVQRTTIIQLGPLPLYCPSVCPELIANGNFDSIDVACVNHHNDTIQSFPNPFGYGCICGWTPSHGSAEFWPSQGTHAIMGCSADAFHRASEGIIQELQTPLDSTKHYFLSFSYRDDSARHAHRYIFYATFINTNLNQTNLFTCSINNIPAPNPRYDVAQVGDTQNWTKVLRCFKPDHNYQRIWFYPRTTNDSCIIQMIDLDSVSLEMLDGSLANHTISCSDSVAIGPLCPSTNPAVHYLWNTGQTTAHIYVHPTHTTIYSLTVSVVGTPAACSFVLYDTVTVNATVPAPVITGPDYACTDSHLYTISNYNSTYTYTITAVSTNGTAIIPVYISSTQFQVNWIYPYGGTITVHVINPATGCDNTATFSVAVCCLGNPDSLSLYNTTSSAMMADPIFAPYFYSGVFITGYRTCCSAQITPYRLSINGTFTVDSDLYICSSHIVLGKDAKIIVNPGKIFRFLDCVLLESCDGVNMWDGIYLTDATSQFICDNDTIKDAKNAVVSNNGGYFDVERTIFQDNYKGIVVNAYSSNHTGKVIRSTFTSTGHLLIPHHMVHPTPSNPNFPACGIELNSVANITIGFGDPSPATFTNNFNNLLTGIVVNQSSFHILNSNFSDLPGNVIQMPGGRIGCGIYCYNTGSTLSATIGGGNTGDGCTFTNVGEGVFFRNSYANITGVGNSFSRVGYGFDINNALNSTIDLEQNDFVNYSNGIKFTNTKETSGSGSVKVMYNNFNATTQPSPVIHASKAIWFTNPGIPLPSISHIVENTIYDTRIGIDLLNVAAADVSGNTINYVLPPTTSTVNYGIRLQNIEGATVARNTIWNQRPTQYSVLGKITGIGLNKTIHTLVEENEIISMGSGIKIAGDCQQSTNLLCNTMHECWNGVYFDTLNPGNKINDVGSAIFNPAYDPSQSISYKNKWVGSYSSSTQQWKVGGIMAPTYQFNWLYDNSGAQFDPHPFRPNLFTALPCSSSTSTCSPPLRMSQNDRDQILGNIVQGIYYDENGDELQYYDNTFFYKMIMEHPEWLNLGLYDDYDYQDMYAQLQNSNYGKFDEVQAQIDYDNRQQALTKLAAMVSENTIEQNKQFTMEKYLQYYYVGADNIDTFQFAEPDSETIAQLTGIALQHPFFGGEGVFYARAMLGLDVEDTVLPACRKKPYHPIGVLKQTKGYFRPNPANTKVTFTFKEGFPENSRLVINNTLGYEVAEYLLPAKHKNYTFNAENLPAGIYCCRIISNETIQQTTKLVIAK